MLQRTFFIAPIAFCFTMFILMTTTPSIQAQTEYYGTVESGGLPRQYLVHLPPSYDGTKPTPVVLALHGGGGSIQGMVSLTHLSDVADQHEFIVVYPNAYINSWADGRGTTQEERLGVNDVIFISDLIDHLTTEININVNRVYATGMSNGGMMSQRLACELSDQITAVAIVAASLAENIAPTCRPQRPVPTMVINGTHDPLVPWIGGSIPGAAGGRVLATWATIDKWVEFNGCSSCATTENVPDWIDDGTRTRRETYGGCGADVVLLTVAGGGHTWPGGLQYLPEWLIGRTSRDFDASEVLWEFFQQWSR
jgi:polyhydroxybutyrate depolymerase